jgi:hypothetical protein
MMHWKEYIRAVLSAVGIGDVLAACAVVATGILIGLGLVWIGETRKGNAAARASEAQQEAADKMMKAKGDVTVKSFELNTADKDGNNAQAILSASMEPIAMRAQDMVKIPVKATFIFDDVEVSELRTFKVEIRRIKYKDGREQFVFAKGTFETIKSAFDEGREAVLPPWAEK